MWEKIWKMKENILTYSNNWHCRHVIWKKIYMQLLKCGKWKNIKLKEEIFTSEETGDIQSREHADIQIREHADIQTRMCAYIELEEYAEIHLTLTSKKLFGKKGKFGVSPSCAPHFWLIRVLRTIFLGWNLGLKWKATLARGVVLGPHCKLTWNLWRGISKIYVISRFDPYTRYTLHTHASQMVKHFALMG